jgi:anti-sigma factor RsiW
MDAATTVHPTDQDLLAYRSGKLVDEVAESVSKHVGFCPACRNRVAAVLSDDDPSRLRDDLELHKMSTATRSQIGGSNSDGAERGQDSKARNGSGPSDPF